jgi:hypothetical protein
VYLLGFHAYINEMHGSRSKIPSKNLVHIYIYIYVYVKFLALLGAPYIYDISRLRVNTLTTLIIVTIVMSVCLSIHYAQQKYTDDNTESLIKVRLTTHFMVSLLQHVFTK